MTLRIISFAFFVLTFVNCKSQARKLPDNTVTTACFKTRSSILPTEEMLPQVKIKKGNSIVFDYVRYKGNDKAISNGDTIETADSDFFERVTFALHSIADHFYYSGDRIKLLNGYHEFHWGESSIANTDFKIKKGFIRGYKLNENWIIEGLVGVVDKQKKDSIIQEIKFSSTFKNCN